MSVLLDGKTLSKSLREDIARAARTAGVVPGLATILVGDDPGSQSYVRSKQRACARAGFRAEDIRLSARTAEGKLIGIIRELNERTDVHGILVQQPLPAHISTSTVVSAVDPEKDVDGFHPYNLGRLMRGEPAFLPCTPFGIMRLLDSAGISVSGRNVVIVGRSLLVGKPLALLLLAKMGTGTITGQTDTSTSRSMTGDATVTVCHSRTPDLGSVTRRADVLVAAVGMPNAIGPSMVRDGAVVIDVGINRVADNTRPNGYRLTGDVDFSAVAPKAAAITPVPGGVGPMTVTMLLYNTLQAARRLHSQDDLFGAAP